MITFREYLLEAIDHEKLAREFMVKYSGDPRGAYTNAKEAYLDVVSTLKKHPQICCGSQS